MGVKISDLTAKGSNLSATDLFEVSIVSGGGYVSRSITGQQISTLTVNSTPIASGTAGRVFFQNASNQLSQSANLFWDNTNNRLGINTATPTLDLDVLGQGRFHTSTANQLVISNPTYANGRLRININDNYGFQIVDNDGYGITHGSSNTGINARQTNISLWTQSGNTTTLRFGGQDLNPTVARTRSIIQPVGSGTTLFSPTSGTAVDYSFQNPSNSRFAPTSGTASYTQVELRPTFDTTSTYSGIGRGLYYNPILTSVVGLTHRAIETTTGDVILGSTSGNVGIGVVTPTFRLDVAGVIQSSEIIRGGVFTAGTGLQATDFVATTGRVRAANGISFRTPTANDNTSIGVFPDAGSGSAGVDIFSAGNKTMNFTWCGNGVGNAYSFTQSYTTQVSTGTINTLNITPIISATVANTVTYRGIYYNPTISNLNGGTHIGLQTTTGSVIFNSTSGNVAIGGTSFGTSSDKVLAQYTGTAPGSSPADAYQQYSADITAGNAAPHFRTENGNVVKLYQETTGVAAATLVSNAGTSLTSTDTFDGYTLQQVVKALRNLGILA